MAGRADAGWDGAPPEGFLLVLHALASEAVPKRMQQEALAKGERVREVVRTLVAEGQTAGEVVAGDVDELAGVFLACIQGLAAGAAFPPRWRSPLPEVDTLLRLLEPRGTRDLDGTHRAAGSLRRGSRQDKTEHSSQD